jgi:uncharacterized membrane protein
MPTPRAPLKSLLAAQDETLQRLHNLVEDAICDENLITKQLQETEEDDNLTFGERLADRVADFGGSWTFILLFAGVLIGWILINTVFLLRQPAFDPYPFILLNLVLSCLAAIQAPVIMMSQNRQEAKDRRRARNDYATNLKAEIEIQNLHRKLDQLLDSYLPNLLELQKEQTRLLNKLTNLDSEDSKRLND